MPDTTPEQPTTKTPRRRASTALTTADTTGEILVVKPRAPRKPKAPVGDGFASSDDDTPRPRRTKRAPEATQDTSTAAQPSVIPAHLKRATGPITLSLPAIPREMLTGATRTPTTPTNAPQPLADPPTTDLGAMPNVGRSTYQHHAMSDDQASPADSLAARKQQVARNARKTTTHPTEAKASATDSSKMAAVQNSDTFTTRNLPAIVPTSAERQVVSPGLTRARDHRTDPSLTAYDVTFIPGTHKLTTTHTTPRRAPGLHPKSRHRQHRFVLLGAVALVLTLAISFVPVARALGVPLGKFAGTANAFVLPTATPAPYYPDHPVVSGERSFVCMALPFARLAQQEMVQEGMAHPWYVSVILAQWGVEQGWSLPSYTGYNWGNVSAIPGSPAVGGIPVPGSPSAFAYAYTPMQGMNYYVLYVQKGFYTGVAAAYPNGAAAQAVAIGQSPWDADHYNLGGQYGGKLLSAMNAFGLQRFDNPNVYC